MALEERPPMTPDVSICIATFRRPRGLVRLLDSLSKLKLPDGLRVEILVVDNDARGGARAGARARGVAVADVRWFVEPVQNIARARNRAIDAARGRWVAFIDDDEVADENWLAAYWSQVLQDVGDGFFGPVLPRLQGPPRPWLDLATFYSRPRHASGTPVPAAELSTSNALLRRSLFAERRFDPAWGPTGGSDFELFEAMRAAGASFLWCDEAVVVETVPARRYRLRWLTQRAFRGGVGFTRLQRQRRRARAGSFARALAAFAVLTLALPVAALCGRRAAARIWLRLCSQVGHLWAHAGGSYEEYRRPVDGARLE
jgi:succinoglycan biosynthesis protein ExoM